VNATSTSSTGRGVYGEANSNSASGVYGKSTNGDGVKAVSDGNGTALTVANSSTGYAAIIGATNRNWSADHFKWKLWIGGSG
jgi:hypothetical protein